MTTTLRWQLLALIVIVGAVFWSLAPVLTPFAIAAMFAYLFDPLVTRLQRWRLSRGIATAIVFLSLTLVFILALLWLIPYLQHQVATLIRRLPDWIGWLQTDAVPWLNAKFDMELEMPDVQQLVAVLQRHWKEAGGLAATFLATVSKSGFALLTWAVHVLIVPVAFFYLLRDWRSMIGYIHDLLPRSIEPVVARLAHEADETLGGFLRGQLSVMIVLGVLYAIGLLAIGIDVGPLIGLVAGLISFVPYLGAITGVLMGAIAAFVQYHDWMHVAGVLLVFGVGHVIEGYVLVPRLVGEKIGLHPLAVIFAILAGGELFGFLGVLLALPVASVAMVGLRYLGERYRASELYGSGQESAIASAAPAGTTQAPAKDS